MKSVYFLIASEFVSLVDSIYIRSDTRISLSQKLVSFIDVGIWIPCSFSDWCVQFVVAAKNRVCHDFTDLNRVMIKNAYSITTMSDIFSKMSGKGLFSIWDADHDYHNGKIALMSTITFTKSSSI